MWAFPQLCCRGIRARGIREHKGIYRGLDLTYVSFGTQMSFIDDKIKIFPVGFFSTRNKGYLEERKRTISYGD